MRRGNVNVKVLKAHENKVIGVRVELTRKMTIAGNIIFAVVITNINTGAHYKILVHEKLGEAFATYKSALA